MTTIDPAEIGDVTLDIGTLTLGEAAKLEAASGQDLSDLLARQSGRMLAAVFVAVLRRSGSAPPWSEISNLRVLDVSSSTSRAKAAGRRPRSNG